MPTDRSSPQGGRKSDEPNQPARPPRAGQPPQANRAAKAKAKRGIKRRPKQVILAYSQSNFRSLSPHDWSPPANLYVFDGGTDDSIGSTFAPCPKTEIRVPYAIVAHMAEQDPGTDYYLLVCATAGTGVLALVGMPYIWSASLNGDPGPGALGFDSATPGEVSEIRYSKTDADGVTRFGDDTNLSETGRSGYPARIVPEDGSSAPVAFNTLGEGLREPSYRRQGARIRSAATRLPADGSRVILYPAKNNMRAVIQRNVKAAFDALGLKGRQRVFSQVLIWPTESDAKYGQAYAEVDHPRLMDFLSRWTDDSTRYLYTLPWPHNPNPAVANTIRRWWREIEDIVARHPEGRTLVSLEDTSPEDWRDDGNIHVGDGPSKARIGLLIAESAARGGMVARRRPPSEPSPELPAQPSHRRSLPARAWSRSRRILGRIKRKLLT